MTTVMSRRSILQLALAPAFLSRAQVDDLAPTVSRVHPGTDGRLVYVPDEQGNTILDSSHAGYGGGGSANTLCPVKVTIGPVAGDNTDRIHAASTNLCTPVDKSGSAAPCSSGWVLQDARGPDSGQRRCATREAWVTSNDLVVYRDGRLPAPQERRYGRWSRRRIWRWPVDARADRGRLGSRPRTRRSRSSPTTTCRRRAQLQGRIARAFRRGDTPILRRMGNDEWIAAIG